MRTTININEQVLRAAKLRAAESHRTLTSVIEDALRLALKAKPARAADRRVSTPVAGSSGLRPEVDLDDNASLLDRIDP